MSLLEAALRRDCAIVLAGLAAIVALAWLYLLRVASTMSAEMIEMDRHAAMGMVMPRTEGWAPADALLMFVMWTVMMVAMMVPSATPMILVFSTLHRRRREKQQPTVPVAIFLAGYLVVWAGYAVVATLAQWGLHSVALLSASMATTSAVGGGMLLIAAGVFQWTPLKQRCLANCRSPLEFLMTRWREGARGAFVMGLDHGLYCVGCCWMLMTLLFVGGVMNLWWVVGIALYVFLEKVAPTGPWLSRTLGAALILGSVALAVPLLFSYA